MLFQHVAECSILTEYLPFCIQMKHHIDEECRHVKCSCGEVVSYPYLGVLPV